MSVFMVASETTRYQNLRTGGRDTLNGIEPPAPANDGRAASAPNADQILQQPTQPVLVITIGPMGRVASIWSR